MNTSVKGSRIEERFIAALEAMGYICEKARAVRYRYRGQSYTKVYDFFRAPGTGGGAFDIVALHPTKPVLLVSVTTDNVSITSKVRAIEPVRRFINPVRSEAIIARWIAPDKPGERGLFGLYRLDDDFGTRHLFTPGDPCFPWEMPLQKTFSGVESHC